MGAFFGIIRTEKNKSLIIWPKIIALEVIMPLTENSSFPVAIILAILTFSGMQMAKPILVSTQFMTIVGGFAGLILFVFLLTAVGNLESLIFGKGFQTKLLETVLAMALA